MPVKKWLKPYARSTEATKEVRPRLEIVEEILMLTTPKWNWKKFRATMTLKEACDKVWISDMTLRNWRQENPKIWEYFNNMKLARKEMVHNMMETAALENVMEWLWGWVKLRPLDKINISLRYLEKASPEFNQSIKIDSPSTTNIQINMGNEEMQQRVMELAAALWITNLKNYERKVLSTALPTNSNEEPSWDWKTSSETNIGWTVEASWSEWVEES